MEAFGAFMISLLPYLAPVIGVLLVYLAKRLTTAVEANQNASAAAKAAASFVFKAAQVVAAIEQKRTSDFKAACADGKITKEEAASLAASAVGDLLAFASGELDAMGIKDPAARTRVATAAVESAVFALPKRNRVQQTTASTAANSGGIK